MKKFLKSLPIVIVVIIASVFFILNRDLSVKEILGYTPENKILAAAFLLVLYFLKSFTIILPIDVLSAVGGIMFSYFWGSLINLLGVAISISVSYWIGRYSASDLHEKLAQKYPKIEKLRQLERNNDFFFSFIVRALGILPCDIVGMYMGSSKINFKTYFIGGMLGFSPSIILVTILGVNLDKPSSPILYIILLFNLVFSSVSFGLYKLIKKRRGRI